MSTPNSYEMARPKARIGWLAYTGLGSLTMIVRRISSVLNPNAIGRRTPARTKGIRPATRVNRPDAPLGIEVEKINSLNVHPVP